MLKIDLSGSVTNNNHTIGYQTNRRNLEINPYIFVDPNFTYICLILQYKYQFDYVSRRTRFKKNKRAIVGNVNYKCKDIFPNYTYVLETPKYQLLHFTFHSPNMVKDRRYRGAFHLNLDWLDRGTVERPFRAFNLDTRQSVQPQRFLEWDEYDTSMNGFFTTKSTRENLFEITPFLQKHRRSIQLIFPNGSGGMRHVIHDFVRPLYDHVVTHILNPLLLAHGTTISVPVAVNHVPGSGAADVVDCSGLHLLRNDAVARGQFLQIPGRQLIMGGRGRTLRNGVVRRTETGAQTRKRR